MGTDYATSAFDAAWAIALALNSTAVDMPLENFRYAGHPNNATDLLLRGLHDVNFVGVSSSRMFFV